MSTDYCTSTELKTALSLTGQTFADADISQAITAASRAIDDFTGRRFYLDADANQARKFWPTNPGYVVIDDLVTFTSLVAQDSTWVLDSDFYLEPMNAPADGRPYTGIRTIARPFIFTLQERPAGWVGFDGRVTVTGKWGWPAVPAPIAEATRMLAERYLKRMREAPFGVVMGGDIAVRLPRLDPDVALLIQPYTQQIIA